MLEASREEGESLGGLIKKRRRRLEELFEPGFVLHSFEAETPASSLSSRRGRRRQTSFGHLQVDSHTRHPHILIPLQCHIFSKSAISSVLWPLLCKVNIPYELIKLRRGQI